MNLWPAHPAKMHTVAMFEFDNDPPNFWYGTWAHREGFRMCLSTALRLGLGYPGHRVIPARAGG